MTDEIKDKDKETIEKLQAVIDQYEVERFDAEDRIVLHKMIELWKAFEVLGKVANFGRNIAIWIAGLTILWFTPIDQIGKTIKSFMGIQ